MSDSDILKRAKAAAEKFKSSDESVNHVFWGYRAAEELLPELIAEVEAKNKQIKELQDLIDKPPEEADWVADYHLLQSALDGPIIDAARKWHAAYRNAQNSNLMRAKEVERLRSVYLAYSRKHDENMLKVIARNKEQRARIKELEADRIAYRNLGSRIEDLETYIEQLEAAFLKAEKANLMHHMDADYADENAREALERIKEGRKSA